MGKGRKERGEGEGECEVCTPYQAKGHIPTLPLTVKDHISKHQGYFLMGL